MALFALAAAALGSGNPALRTLYRPPPNTSVQNEVLAANIANAAAESEDARDELLGMLSCSSEKCERMTQAELLDLLAYEFERLPLIHNGPYLDSEVGDDTDLNTTLLNGYLQNVVHRYVLGYDKDGHALAESATMERLFGYPAFKNTSDPTLIEANDRMLFLANNWEKSCVGNPQYGSVVYALNPLFADQLFVAPADTGIHKDRVPVSGTMQHFFHVMVQHLQIYDYSISEMFAHWYDGDRLDKCTGSSFCYFEINLSANFWLPEALLFLTAKYSELFGSVAGTELQRWMRTSGRPLLWAESSAADCGMLLDPWVDIGLLHGSGHGLFINEDDVDQFRDAWRSPPVLSFEDLHAKSPTHLRLQFRSFFHRDLCTQTEAGSQNMVIGVLPEDGMCVFWVQPDAIPAPSPARAPSPFPSAGLVLGRGHGSSSAGTSARWECTNDGSCVQSTDATRARWTSHEACFAECGQGRWACKRPAPGHGARPSAHHCTPDPAGAVSGGVNGTAGPCEAACR